MPIITKKPIGGWIFTGSLLIATAALIWFFQRPRAIEAPRVQPTSKQSTSATATAPVPAWKEPDSFMGAKFGEDLRISLPHCPARIADTKEVCWWYTGLGDEYGIHNTGLGQVTAKLLYSKLEHVTIEFSSIKAAEFLSILSERYGPPTSLKKKPWKSKAGTEFTNTVAEWVGANVSIRFEERFATRDEGIIMYLTAAWLAHAEQERKERIKERAGRL